MRTAITAASASGNGGPALAALIGAGVLLFGVALLAGRRAYRRHMAGAQSSGSLPRPTLAGLEAQVSGTLVETDDAVMTSDQELGFAVARFGERAAAPFSAALQAARAELSTAFSLRQQLDDDAPASERARRTAAAEIAARCARASSLLDEQAAAFDQLQGLEARAPEVTAEVTAHIRQQAERTEHAEQALSLLTARYTTDAVAVVAGNPRQAQERLEFARASTARARKSMETDDIAEAAAFLQAAESAADQAESLLDGVGRMEAKLTQASSALPTALREIDADIAEATALLDQGGAADDRTQALAGAREAAAAVRGQIASGLPFDSLVALRLLGQAASDLGRALAGTRQERERRERAGAVLDQAMLVARSAITAAADFITTRRGGVGATARTRLAEAHRHFQRAIAQSQDDPPRALAEAEHADLLAQQARSLAEQDVAGFGGGLGGAILGGILIDAMPADGAGDNGFRTPGSFGGLGTRGRHSISGWF